MEAAGKANIKPLITLSTYVSQHTSTIKSIRLNMLLQKSVSIFWRFWWKYADFKICIYTLIVSNHAIQRRWHKITATNRGKAFHKLPQFNSITSAVSRWLANWRSKNFIRSVGLCRSRGSDHSLRICAGTGTRTRTGSGKSYCSHLRSEHISVPFMAIWLGRRWCLRSLPDEYSCKLLSISSRSSLIRWRELANRRRRPTCLQPLETRLIKHATPF